jgi:predicted transposase YbfD/YdcC
MDESTTEKSGHMTFTCLGKIKSYPLTGTLRAHLEIWEKSHMDLRVKINNELRRIRRKIDSEKIPAEKIHLINAYEDLAYTLKAPAKSKLM